MTIYIKSFFVGAAAMVIRYCAIGPIEAVWM
jgi:hypothetical protein